MLPLGALGRQSSSACKEVRHAALGHLQRIFPGTQFSAGVQAGFDFRILFDRVLFPILEELLKPQVYVKDQQGMGEARLRVSALACKSFLHFSVRSADDAGDTLELWLSLLKMMDRVMHSGKRDQAVSLTQAWWAPLAILIRWDSTKQYPNR